MSRNNVSERFNAIPELQAKTGAAVANDGSRIVISDGDDMVTFNVEGATRFASWLQQALPLPSGSLDLRLIETEGRDEGLYEDIVKAWNLSRAAGAKPSQVMAALQDAFVNTAAAHRMTFDEVLTALRTTMNEYAASLPFTTEFVELEKPIDMLLFCPLCGLQHIDEPDESTGWDNPPHRSHKCSRCGTIWRQADFATNGVAEIRTKGKADNWPTLKGPTPVALGATGLQQSPASYPSSNEQTAWLNKSTPHDAEGWDTLLVRCAVDWERARVAQSAPQSHAKGEQELLKWIKRNSCAVCHLNPAAYEAYDLVVPVRELEQFIAGKCRIPADARGSAQLAQLVALKTNSLNLSLIRDRNAAIQIGGNGSVYACDVVTMIDDIATLKSALHVEPWLAGFAAAIERVEQYDRNRPMDAPGKLIAAEILIVLKEALAGAR